MEVILLERIEKLGQMGDVVKVKDGYARNYLLPQNKALRANAANIAVFESQKHQLEMQNLEKRKDAEELAPRMDGTGVVLLRQASDSAQLYGSVTARDIAEAVTEAGFTVDRRQVALDRAIKTLGIHPIKLILHPEVSVTVQVNVARSKEEAEAQEAGIAAIDAAEAVQAAGEAAEEEAPEIAELLENPPEAEDEEPEADAVEADAAEAQDEAETTPQT